MMTTAAFTYRHTVEADVSAEAVWSLYEDLTTWPSWDDQAERITRDGPFVTGATGTMTFTGQDPLSYRLTKVEPLREFVDETPAGPLLVRVSHRLEPLAPGRVRITHEAQVQGPDDEAREVGAAITADFPDTMAALVRLATERSA
jgi:polyketide cyclase/dehydrase/lipid transport protein